MFVFGHPEWTPKCKDPALNTSGNATSSYLAAGYSPKNRTVAYRSASAALRRPDVQIRINELRDEQVRFTNLHLVRWKSMVMDAQRVLLEAMHGGEVTNQAIRAAEITMDQAIGPSRFRFCVQTGADKDGAQNIIV